VIYVIDVVISGEEALENANRERRSHRKGTMIGRAVYASFRHY
jgi:hypothetical protein